MACARSFTRPVSALGVEKAPTPKATIQGFEAPVCYGVHGGIKGFYGVDPDKEHAAPLDPIVGAVGHCPGAMCCRSYLALRVAGGKQAIPQGLKDNVDIGEVGNHQPQSARIGLPHVSEHPGQ